MIMSSKKLPTAPLSKRPRIVFTQGGKGGVGKTDLSLSLVSWYREIDDPALGRIGVVRVNGEIVAAREGEPTDRGYIFVRPLQD
jgi:hypothetical protein